MEFFSVISLFFTFALPPVIEKYGSMTSANYTYLAIGIAAGMLDGMGLSSLKGALMSRGTREVSRLIAAMGGNGFSAYGLCHLGDYEATVFSQYSHNRRFGEMFVRGEPYTELAEGYDTVKALCALADRYHVDLPIGRAVYAVLYDGAQPKEQMNQLFTRSLKREFDI